MGGHIVQLYQDEADLVDPVSRFAAGGLVCGEGVVVIGTTARWEASTARLRADGENTHGAVRRRDPVLGLRALAGGPSRGGLRERVELGAAQLAVAIAVVHLVTHSDNRTTCGALD